MERREFIAKSAVVGGGLALSSLGSISRAAESASGIKKLNIALVGVGAEGEILLNSLLKIPGLNFVAVCDIWKYRVRYGAARCRAIKQRPKMYEDYKDIIADDAKLPAGSPNKLDCAIIATPDFWHAPQTVDFLKAGINVYCEKMMSNTVEGARQMVRAARESKKLLQIGHQRKSNPRYIYAKEKLIDEVKLCGTLLAANGQWNRSVTKDITWPKKYTIPEETLKKYGYKDMHQFRNWRWYKGLGGGPISDLGAHQIDIFAWFFGGRPKTIMASGNSDYYKKDWYDNVMCIYEYQTNQNVKAQAFYQVLTTTGAGGGYFEQFMGDRGTIKMSENASITNIFKENDENINWDQYVRDGILKEVKEVVTVKQADVRESKPLKTYGFPFEESTKPIHMHHLENFFNAVRGKEKLNCDGEHAFEAEAAVYKVNEAIEAKKQLEFTEEDFVA